MANEQNTAGAKSLSANKMRVVLFIVFAAVLLSLGIAVISYRDGMQQTESEALSQCSLIADVLKYSARRHDNRQELESLVRLFGEEPGVKLIVVVGGEPRRVLASSDRSLLGQELADLPKAEIGEDIGKVFETGERASQYHDQSSAYDLTIPLEYTIDRNSGDRTVSLAAMIHLDARPISRALLFSSFKLFVIQLFLISCGTVIALLILKKNIVAGRWRQEQPGGDLEAKSTEGRGLEEQAGRKSELSCPLPETTGFCAAAEKRCRQVSSVCGSLIVIISAGVLYGYLSDSPFWINWGIPGPVMRFNTGLFALISGLGIIALSLQRPILARMAGLIVLMCGMITLVQFPLQIDLGIDELFFKNHFQEVPLSGARMGSNSAVCYVLIGIALTIVGSRNRQDWHYFLTTLFASAVFIIAMVANVGHLTGLTAAHGWGGAYGMSVQTAICFTISGGFLTLMGIGHSQQRLSKWYPLVVGNAAIIGSIILWHALEFQDSERVRHAVETQFDSLQVQSTITFRHLENSLLRMAARWDIAGGTPEEAWRDDARNYLHDLVPLKALIWINKDNQPAWSVYEDNAVEFRADNYPEIMKAIDLSRRLHHAEVVATRQTDNSRSSVLWMSMPLAPHGVDDGCLLAEIDMAELMNNLLARIRLEGQIVTIRDGSDLLYTNKSGTIEENPALRQTADLSFTDSLWTLTDVPTYAWIASKRSWLPEMTLAVSLLLSLLVTVMLQLAAKAHGLYRQATQANSLLAAEMEERKTAEEKLRETLSLQQAILDNAQPSIITTQPDGTIQVFNKAAERMLGYKAVEMVGSKTPSVIHDVQEVAKRARELSGELSHTIEPGFEVFVAKPALGIPDVREWTYVRKDGTRFPVLLSITALRDPHDKITGYLGIANDITDLKKAEKELRRAKQVAEEASQAKSEFLANMSHEIRTPMNGVLGMAELALGTKLDEEQKDYVETIKESAEALLTVINDILDFSKVEAGKLELENIAFNLRDKLKITINTLAHKAREKGLELTLDVSPDVPAQIVGDPDRLRQIIVNLIGNALKFTEKGSIKLRVDHQHDTQGDENLCLLLFSVSDTGIGIPAEKQKLIFDAFSQADSSTTRRFGGTGLGLSISSRLVGLMGGQIWIESEEGKGSTFHFTARFQLATQSEDLSGELQLFALKNMPVLVVDDNATNRHVMKDVLKNWQMKPVLANFAEEALKLAEDASSKETEYPLILVDYLMPGMDGCELITRLKKYSSCRQSTFIMLSSSSADDIIRCRESGITTYLQKPISQAILLETILSAMKNNLRAEKTPDKPIKSKPDSSLLKVEDTDTQTQRKFNILLAEDNRINQKVAVRMLKIDGHEVTVANNGKEALSAMTRDHYDLILMDVQMPEIDGLRATEAIRKNEKNTGKHMPIIAMTAHAMKEDQARCLAAGMDGYVSKPVNHDDLRHAVASAMSQEEQTAEDNDINITSPPLPAPSDIDPNVFDCKAALAKLDGSLDFLQELATILNEDAPAMMADIREALDKQEAVALEKTAHRLKGSLAPFCAPAATALAEKLETIGRTEDELPSAKDFSDQLDEELRKLLQILNTTVLSKQPLTADIEASNSGEKSHV